MRIHTHVWSAFARSSAPVCMYISFANAAHVMARARASRRRYKGRRAATRRRSRPLLRFGRHAARYTRTHTHARRQLPHARRSLTRRNRGAGWGSYDTSTFTGRLWAGVCVWAGTQMNRAHGHASLCLRTTQKNPVCVCVPVCATQLFAFVCFRHARRRRRCPRPNRHKSSAKGMRASVWAVFVCVLTQSDKQDR